LANQYQFEIAVLTAAEEDEPRNAVSSAPSIGATAPVTL
jgi:hypothetical protein